MTKFFVDINTMFVILNGGTIRIQAFTADAVSEADCGLSMK